MKEENLKKETKIPLNIVQEKKEKPKPKPKPKQNPKQNPKQTPPERVESISDGSNSLNEVEIEEIHIDHKIPGGMHHKKHRHLSSSSDKLKTGNLSTGDVVDFSSLKECQNHDIFVSDIKCNPGKVRLENGSIYDGEWLKGVRTGKGTLIWPNGSIYEVSMKSNRRVLGKTTPRTAREN